ncbi:hypothetical protein AVEN_49434-1 [Araneus ventricosus]|uniref:Uncharacterized protein n=1 Tax=Araneus ventricosus TaxID=182803 RepID=A0A4Y2CNW9_ARAVE|nr:hypothetical protein AVEN_49434-1 [Araneus ventricosus]
MLKVVHKQRRVNWAKYHQTWKDQWHRVIFSKEKKLNLDGPDGIAFSFVLLSSCHEERRGILSSRLLIRFFTFFPLSLLNIRFIHSLNEWSPAFPSLHWIIVLSVDQQLTFQRQQGGGSLIVWGGFGYSGKLNLAFSSGRMKATDYQEMLETVVSWPRCDQNNAKLRLT